MTEEPGAAVSLAESPLPGPGTAPRRGARAAWEHEAGEEGPASLSLRLRGDGDIPFIRHPSVDDNAGVDGATRLGTAVMREERRCA